MTDYVLNALVTELSANFITGLPNLLMSYCLCATNHSIRWVYDILSILPTPSYPFPLSTLKMAPYCTYINTLYN